MELLKCITAGSVDDGKSTLMGRLLYDGQLLPTDTISALKKYSFNKDLDFSLVTDGLKWEREQKITIDVAYRYFSTHKRKFILIDAPGHELYTRNMATGASQADVALMIVDAERGISVQTRRHSFILSLMGIKSFVVVFNKMDLVYFRQRVFEQLKEEFLNFFQKINNKSDLHFIPISALKGEGVVFSSQSMSWYSGPTLLSLLETIPIKNEFQGEASRDELRLPIQIPLRPNSEFRGYAGTVVSGNLRVLDEILILPSFERTRVKNIYSSLSQVDFATTNQPVVVEVTDEVDISSGNMLVHLDCVPSIGSQFEADLIWMHESPLKLNQLVYIKHTTRWEKALVTQIRYEIDPFTFHKKNQPNTLLLNQIGRVQIQTTKNLFFDPYEKNRKTGSFILVDPIHHSTLAAGFILSKKTVEDLTFQQKSENLANVFPTLGYLSQHHRETQFQQKALTLWFTGFSGAGKSTITIELEKILFSRNYKCIRLDGDDLRHGLNKDLGFSPRDRAENIRRVAEVSKLLNESGLIVLVSLISPYALEREKAKQIIGVPQCFEVFVDAPLEVCEKRDPKGIYVKARQNQINALTGLSSPYEPPLFPDLHLKTDEMTLDQCVQEAIQLILNFQTKNSIKTK